VTSHTGLVARRAMPLVHLYIPKYSASYIPIYYDTQVALSSLSNVHHYVIIKKFIHSFINGPTSLCWEISQSQGLYLHTDIHAPSVIRTHDHSVRADRDSSCLRPRGHRDRHNEEVAGFYFRYIPVFTCRWEIQTYLHKTFPPSRCLHKARRTLCRSVSSHPNRGSHRGDCLLGCDAVQSGSFLPMFRVGELPPVLLIDGTQEPLSNDIPRFWLPGRTVRGQQHSSNSDRGVSFYETSLSSVVRYFATLSGARLHAIK
jgi:hypothetical protein